ncbi:hypothetical protein M3Y97_00060200 [Aphelenchoides bicaudatus]|nr:hypothetical protein M3Y97_00060200 [Aphelenchoides bicaudatus]
MSNTIENDDDDFGDFEEAQFEEKEEEAFVESSPVENPANVNIEPFENFAQAIDVNLLSDLLNDKELWNVDPTLNNQSEVNLFDLFSHFGCRDVDLTPDNAKRAIELWNLLHVVEETNALHFRWPTSQIYSHFIEALSFCESQQSTSSAGVCVQKPSGFLATGEFSVKRPIEETTNEIDLTSNEWTLPDYSNNPSSTLDCDFFQTTDYRNNGLSVLEQELCALGLSAQAKSSKQTNNPVVVNGTSHKQQKADHAPRYLSVSELNEDAQAFYERMPDFSFLLVDRVLRKH